jgi:hypothetical protein
MPQGPRSIEPACRDCWGDAARQSDLFGDGASDLVRMPISGELLGDLGFGEVHRFGDPAMPRWWPAVSPAARSDLSVLRPQLMWCRRRLLPAVQDLIQAHGHRIRAWRLGSEASSKADTARTLRTATDKNRTGIRAQLRSAEI